MFVICLCDWKGQDSPPNSRTAASTLRLHSTDFSQCVGGNSPASASNALGTVHVDPSPLLPGGSRRLRKESEVWVGGHAGDQSHSPEEALTVELGYRSDPHGLNGERPTKAHWSHDLRLPTSPGKSSLTTLLSILPLRRKRNTRHGTFAKSKNLIKHWKRTPLTIQYVSVSFALRLSVIDAVILCTLCTPFELSGCIQACQGQNRLHLPTQWAHTPRAFNLNSGLGVGMLKKGMQAQAIMCHTYIV